MVLKGWLFPYYFLLAGTSTVLHISVCIEYSNLKFLLTSEAIKGAKIPPILADTEVIPNPLLRTSVGNNSLV